MSAPELELLPGAVLVDFPIVLAYDGYTVDSSVAHLPARERRMVRGHGLVLRWDDHDAPPFQWESECGVRGWTYNRGGPLKDLEICAECAVAAGWFKDAA